MATRTTYTIANFPFDKLRVGGAGKKDVHRSDFGTAHQKIKIETSPGNLEDFLIELPEIKSNAISYYIDPKGNNLNNPSFYLHPILHPLWATPNEKGEISHKTTADGIATEEFFEKFAAAFNRECLKIPEDDRIWMMGEGSLAEKADENTEFLAPIALHPKFPDNHPRVGRRDLDKSKTLDLALWTQDTTKRTEVDKKKKYSNVKSSKYNGPSFTAQNSVANATTPEEKKNDDFLVPDTNTIIFTGIYDLTSANKKKVGAAKAGEQIKDYDRVKKFIYNAQGHPNANDVNCDMTIIPTLLAPMVTWDINGKPGALKLKASKIKINYYKQKDFNRAIPTNELAAIAASSKRKRAELGLSEESSEDDQNKEEKEEDEKEPNFNSDFERNNYLEQKECEKKLRALDEKYDSLIEQKNDPNTTTLKLKAVDKELSFLQQRQQKVLLEQTDLQNELEEWLKKDMDVEGEEEDDEEDDGEDFEDSAGCEPAKKKAKLSHETNNNSPSTKESKKAKHQEEDENDGPSKKKAKHH